MAELRCPMCSKINPDTLDVCQFCGARLRPLFLSPTTPLERPAEPGKPATTPAPAPTTPPSSGGTDDWLGQLRGGTSSFDSSSEEPASSPDATEGVDDWLAKLRAQDEKDDVDWLQTSGSADETLVSKGK
ncbi:MAG: hypothetical protein AABZ58_00320, partial [Chloroflexota bacterium]